LRWANDKYKGTQAFRATLWHRKDKSPTRARRFGRPVRHREKKSRNSSTTLHSDGKRLCDNFWQAISQAARDRNAAIEKQAQRKNKCCTTLAAIHTGDVTKIRTRD
jgi:hypothetical protein